MKEIILAKYGELALKGLNKPVFESKLEKTVRRRIADAGDFRVYRAQSTIYAEPQNGDCDIDLALKRMGRIFGFSALCRAGICEKSLESIQTAAAEYLKDQLLAAKTFKVAAKRADKKFPLNSMELAAEVGGSLLERYPHLKVQMDDPDLTVICEVRDYAAYVHGAPLAAAGGLPTGSSGRAAVMLSGGIDSPVAAYMMAKRGLDLCGVHFMSPPYTSERALNKVVDLAGILSGYVGGFALICVPFAEIQLAIGKHCPEELFTVLMRRSMVRITNRICRRENCGAIITGESLAQVASQTLSAVACTDEAAELPVLRPLIGMDKNEIIEIARKIGTFETSILPYEDCCTVFTPKHPKTKPRLEDILKAEAAFDLAPLEEAAANAAEVRMKHFFQIAD